ncbi:MAG: hypothetical protein COV02_01210, partial [Candidatus Terrybacteria bacterium CG10_big_fil_rev_8_21_14_0_10_41_10]
LALGLERLFVILQSKIKKCNMYVALCSIEKTSTVWYFMFMTKESILPIIMFLLGLIAVLLYIFFWFYK